MAIKPIKIKIFGVDLFSDKVAKINKKLSSVGKKLKSVGKGITVGLTLPIVAAGVGAVKLSTDFNAAMANVGTLIPGNQKRLEELKKGVQELAVETGKSTGELSAGLFQVISAFGDTNETLAKLRTNTIGAVAGVAEVEDAIKLTSLVTKNFGDITNKATGDVLNLAFKANELGQTTFPEMAASMGPTVPLVKALGVEVEELFGVMGTFTGVTGNTSEVVTQLRSFLGALIKPTGDMEKAFKKLGVRSGKELIKMKGLQGAMDALVNVTKPYPGILGKVLGRKEALTLVLAGAGELSEAFAEKTFKMTKAMGATDKAFKEQTQGINKTGFAFKKFGQRLVVMAQKFGDAVAPMLNDIIDFLSPLISKLSGLSPITKKVIFIMGGLAAAIGPLIIIIGAASAAIGAISLPITLIITGIIALGAAITFLIFKWQTVMTWIRKIPGPILFLLGPLGLLLKGVQLLSDNWSKVVLGFKKAFGVFNKFRTPILILLGPLGFLTEIGVQIAKNWEKVVSIFEKLSNILGKVTSAAKKLTKSTIAKVSSFFGRGEGPTADLDESGRSSVIPANAGPQNRVDNLFSSLLGKLDSTLSKIEVKFQNEPKGLQVTTDTGGADLAIERGLATGGT